MKKRIDDRGMENALYFHSRLWDSSRNGNVGAEANK